LTDRSTGSVLLVPKRKLENTASGRLSDVEALIRWNDPRTAGAAGPLHSTARADRVDGTYAKHRVVADGVETEEQFASTAAAELGQNAGLPVQ